MQTSSSVPRYNAGPVVYIARQSSLAKIDVSRETILWQRQIVGLGSTLILFSDILYLYSSLYGSIVYAFHREDGRLLWRIQIAAHHVRAGVQLNEILQIKMVAGVLYVALRDGSMYALDAEQGALLRKYETHQVVDETFLGTLDLVVENNMLYLTGNNRLCAIDLRSGQQHWEHIIDGRQCFLTHTLASNEVYACADLDPNGTYIYAIDALSGKRIWRSSLFADPIFEAPAIVNDSLYCVGSHNVYSISRHTGQPLWIRSVGATNFRTPVIIGDLLFLGVYDGATGENSQGALLALKRIGGAPDWYRRFPHKPYIQGHWRHQICVSDETLTRLYSFDITHGTLLWRLNAGSIGDTSASGFGSALVIADA